MTVINRAAATRFFALTAITVLAVSSANAATKKAAAKSAKAIKPAVATATTTDESAQGIEPVSMDSAPAKPVAGSAATTLNTNSTVPATTSTASLPEAIKAASPRKVFGEFYTETYDSMDDFQKGVGTPQFDSYAGVKFDLGNSRSFSVRQNFDYTGAQEAGMGAFHIQDIALNYADGKLATFAGDGTITFIAREYLPTGENSRNNGNMGAERLYLVGSKSYGKLDLSYVVMGTLSNNTRDSFMNPATGKETQNRWGYAVHEFDAFYNLSDKFAVGALVGNDYYFYRPLAGKADSKSTLYVQPTLQYAPVKGLTLQAAVYNEINIAHPARDFAFARSEDLSAYFNLAASL